MNIIRYFVFIFLIIIHFGCSTASADEGQPQNNDALLTLCCLKKSYQANKPIKFQVSNNTDNEYWLSCAVEAKRKSEWIEIYASIHSSPGSKTGAKERIKPRQSKNLSWLHKIKSNRDKFDKYRFNLGIYRVNGELISTINSDEFEIN